MRTRLRLRLRVLRAVDRPTTYRPIQRSPTKWMNPIPNPIHREGAKICLLQCSYEAPAIFTLLQLVLASEPKDDGDLQGLKAASGGKCIASYVCTGLCILILSDRDPVSDPIVDITRIHSQRRGLGGLPDLGRGILRCVSDRGD